MKEEEKEKNVLKRISYSSRVEANSGLKIKEFSRSEGSFFLHLMMILGHSESKHTKTILQFTLISLFKIFLDNFKHT